MKKLVFIQACVRGADSRTLRIAEPVVETLSKRYTVTRFDLPDLQLAPLTPASYAERGAGQIPDWALTAARTIAETDRIVIAAPFWDMSFPAMLKVFIEHVSLFDVTFTDNGQTCKGLCKAPDVLYITTRGMDIPTGDPREQATPYLKALGTLWNLGGLTTLAVQNMDYSTPDAIEAKIADAVSQGLSLAQNW